MTLRMKFFTGITLSLFFTIAKCQAQALNNRFLTYVTTARRVTFFLKDDEGKFFGSLQNLKTFAEAKGDSLEFAMNGGMYKQDHSPQGLFIESKSRKAPLDTLTGMGNFYLLPNGIFFLKEDGSAAICQTREFHFSDDITYATQSGPMLLLNGQMHTAFKKGSSNLNIRNGVGILPDGKIVFVMSKEPVNFYDFSEYFKSLNCNEALYLDGFVSRTYLPSQNWNQLDGSFGVIIGVLKKK
jgi:uncharacterized protein YigE (DUF2233 family)